MNKTLEELKLRNKTTIKNPSRNLFYIIFVMIVLSIVLLLIDSNRFLTPSVLLGFFSIILGIIALFLLAGHKMRNYQIKVKNNIDIVYQDIVNKYNASKNTLYSCSSENDVNKEWLLVPSYANNESTYKISDSDITLYQATSYNKVGAEQKRTYYFKGLYIGIGGFDGDFQFCSKASATEKIINMFKGLYGEDKNDIKRYSSKVIMNSGTLYNNRSEVPTEIEDIINTLNNVQNVKGYKIGVRNNRLHLAVTLINNRVPLIKKYNDEEYEAIKNVMFENLNLLEKIKRGKKNII